MLSNIFLKNFQTLLDYIVLYFIFVRVSMYIQHLFYPINFYFMKKVIVLSLVAIFSVALLSSCKSHEKCPAYGKANTTNVVKNA